MTSPPLSQLRLQLLSLFIDFQSPGRWKNHKSGAEFRCVLHLNEPFRNAKTRPEKNTIVMEKYGEPIIYTYFPWDIYDSFFLITM